MPKKSPPKSLKLKTNLPFAQVIILIFLINIAVATILFVIKSSLPPEVPMFYGKPSGPEQLAKKEMLMFIPLLATTIVVINAFLMRLLKNSFLHAVLVGLSATITVLSTITIFKIVFLVGNLF